VPAIKFRYGRREQTLDFDFPDTYDDGFHKPQPYNLILDKLFPSKATKSYLDLPFGRRPPLTAQEIDAINTGGASVTM
jgi:hypothetical protein